MTKLYYRQKYAKDLKLGEMFVDWANRPPEHGYPEPRRILNVKEKADKSIAIHLDDLGKLTLFPEQLVIIRDIV